MATGICKLTDEEGKFVDAHLVPRAFTRPTKKGLPLVQFGQGSKPTRRWSSWYDQNLVIQKGEDILSDLDNWAIHELRKHRLVWSGWGPMRKLGEDHVSFGDSGWGIREVEGIDPDRLRLFFLSLLWRAAATNRPEFSEVAMPPDDLKKLKSILLRGTAAPLSFYPASLIQLSTIGQIHNLPPIAQTKVIPAVGDDLPQQTCPIFRFYFDGLVAHMHRHASDQGETNDLGPLIVGASKKLVVSTVSYEISFQRENLINLLAEANRDWPELMAKL